LKEKRKGERKGQTIQLDEHTISARGPNREEKGRGRIQCAMGGKQTRKEREQQRLRDGVGSWFEGGRKELGKEPVTV